MLKVTVISPFRNCRDYIEKHIMTVASQKDCHITHIMIDDSSTDQTIEEATRVLGRVETGQTYFPVFIVNKDRKGALYNQLQAISTTDNDSLIVLLDGDDWLAPDPWVLNKIVREYEKNPDLKCTYGSCLSIADDLFLTAQDYPEEVFANRSFREFKFPWNIPYTHLRTFRRYTLNKTKIWKDFCSGKSDWPLAGGDVELFYQLIEQCQTSNQVKAIKWLTTIYNDLNPLNDYKVNSEVQTHVANKSITPKSILIAIPTDKNIEPETFKSIYDLRHPEGCRVDFQYFYGYRVDQIRNLIVDFGLRCGYDYIFFVDHDIVLSPDDLLKLYSLQIDDRVRVTTGCYIQRIPGKELFELYQGSTPDEFYNLEPRSVLSNQHPFPVKACGFGCVLVATSLLKQIPYPHFIYHPAIDHANTLSEDIDFCKKVVGSTIILADPTVLPDHIGKYRYRVDDYETRYLDRYNQLFNSLTLPERHVKFLENLSETQSVKPSVIYDIGACVLSWSKEAKRIWPDSMIMPIDTMSELQTFYNQFGTGICQALSDKAEYKRFYINPEHPHGNSYYQENPAYSDGKFDESTARILRTKRLDDLVKEQNLPYPDMIKIDTQGSELDILKGAEECLKHAKWLIIECRQFESDYNIGAPDSMDVTNYLNTLGFKASGTVDESTHDTDIFFQKD